MTPVLASPADRACSHLQDAISSVAQAGLEAAKAARVMSLLAGALKTVSALGKRESELEEEVEGEKRDKDVGREVFEQEKAAWEEEREELIRKLDEAESRAGAVRERGRDEEGGLAAFLTKERLETLDSLEGVYETVFGMVRSLEQGNNIRLPKGTKWKAASVGPAAGQATTQGLPSRPASTSIPAAKAPSPSIAISIVEPVRKRSPEEERKPVLPKPPVASSSSSALHPSSASNAAPAEAVDRKPVVRDVVQEQEQEEEPPAKKQRLDDGAGGEKGEKGEKQLEEGDEGEEDMLIETDDDASDEKQGMQEE
ncbi:hypothetical protein JCM8547_007332 [Rhodosporidiobolus lusitaniae]